MADSVSDDRIRGRAEARYWGAQCKDCLAEQRIRGSASTGSTDRDRSKLEKLRTGGDPEFEYSGSWADRAFELGQTRSDRCERHRRLHREMIRALSVPYVDLNVIGEVRDRENPTGPLGGLGPLPKPHKRKKAEVDLENFGFGMSDADILTILEGMKEKRVAVIEAGTGTGKSTFMPFRLMSPPDGAAFRLTDAGPIVVTEPRRQAAMGVAGFVGEALVFGHDSRTCKAHVGPGFPVGYQVSGDRKWDSACDLIYVTDGTMINWVRDGSLARIGMVIVDEAHERSANIDIILAQLREKIYEYKHLRVIITSATIDRDFFIDYFGGPSKVFHHSVPEKKSFGYGVPLFVGLGVDSALIRRGLTLRADEDPIKFPGWSGTGPAYADFPPDDLASETEKYAALRCGQEIPKERWVRQMPRALAEQVVAIAEGTDFGDILGFLPTSATINEAIGYIKRALKNSHDFDIYPLLSSTDPAITRAAVAARQRGHRRKIVISSNLAETSLTVSGVRYVVDSGLICQSEWNADIASGGLPKVPHSQSGLKQRWGRVGRDAPGWVFPLYTADQFLSLARDTPPESTRSNLEEFCTRLISTGLDPETAVLPGNFESADYKPDEFAREAAQTFTKELKRANQTLRLGGLVDADGDLTALGREIERYSGTASEALAIALGDRLACLHEVALGISVVARGNLYGGKYSILGVDFDWPPEWRLRADACHRALSCNCSDDLELTIRIASLYQAAEDGSRWCQTWWVNQTALDAALVEVNSVISNLSAAMKHEVARPFSTELLPRARAAITQAFQAQTYQRADDGTFTSILDKKPAAGPTRPLVPPQRLVIAFNRIEFATGPDQVERRINHFVAVEESVIDSSASHVDAISDDFDILLRLADNGARGHKSKATDQDVLAHVRAILPIGCAARFDFSAAFGTTVHISAIDKVREPFLASLNSGSRTFGEDDSGFDPEWDDQQDNDKRPDEDELDLSPINPRSQETNDVTEGNFEPFPEPTRLVLQPEAPRLLAQPLFGIEHLKHQGIYLVSDYLVENGNAVALLEPFSEAQQSMDPARHDQLQTLDEVEVEFLDVVEDAAWSFFRFRMTNTKERFDVPANKFFSLDRYADSKTHNLKYGIRLKAIAVTPAVGRRTITTRSLLRSQLETKGTLRQTSRSEISRLHPAAIVVEPNDFGTLEVALEKQLEPGGISLTAQVRAKWLEAKGIPLTIGQRLQVGFESSPNEDVALSPVTKELEALVKKNSSKLEVRGKRMYARAPIDLNLARRILTLDPSEEWASGVSAFYEASQILSASVVLPPIHEASVAVSELGVMLVKSRQREFEQRYNVRTQLDEAGQLDINGMDADGVAAAINALSALETSAYVAARIPQGTTGKVIGTGGQTIRTLQEIPGVDWLWVDSEIVHIIGISKVSVQNVVNLIKPMVESATGIVSVPSAQIGAFIGPKGAHIINASSISKTRNFRTGVDGQWKIEGASVPALEMFAAIAREKSKDLTLRVVSRAEIEIISQHSPRAKTKRRMPKPKSETPSGKPPSRRTQPVPAKAPPTPAPREVNHPSSAEKAAKIEPASHPESGIWSRIRARLWRP
jgi:HrpA-like RNA helicase